MTRSKILLIGFLSEQLMTGASLGFLSLVNGLRAENISHRVVNILKAGKPRKAGMFSFTRCIQIIIPLIEIYCKIPISHGCYYLISITKAGFTKDFFVIWWAAIWRKRIIVHLHSAGYAEFYSSQHPCGRWIIRKTLNRCDRIITLGESMRHQFDFVSNFESRVVVIRNGPPLEISERISIPKTLQNNRSIGVLYLSNMIPSKGFFDLVKAARILESEFPGKYRFDLCGAFGVSGNESEFPRNSSELIEVLRNWNLTSVVQYHGTIEGAYKDKLLRDSKIFVLPTKYPTEGQPISIIEAMAYGTPVIATRWKGIIEQVLEGKTGYYVDFFSPEDIAKKIVDISTSPSHYEELSKQSYEYYLEYFTRKAHIKNMVDLFREVYDL